MGKSSLAVRSFQELAAQGCRSVFLDLGAWNQKKIEAWLEDFASELLTELGDTLPNPPVPEDILGDMSGFLQRCSEGAERTLIVLDEVDWLQELKYRREIFARLRAAQSKLALRGEASRLGFCFISLKPLTREGAARYGPIIQTLQVPDFPTESAAGERVVTALKQGFNPDVRRRAAIARTVLRQAGGQPYQTMILASEVADKQARSAKQALEVIQAYVDAQRDHPKELFSQIQEMFLEEPIRAHEALNEYESLLRGQFSALGTVGADVLLRSGLGCERNGALAIKGPVFERFFDQRWVSRMRDQLLIAQRQQRPRWRAAGTMKPRICILNTGGTVGMVRRESKVVAPRDEKEFLENYSSLQQIADIDFEQPFVRDSINVYPQQWKQIAETIYRKRDEGYAGFVVAHGTDTMAFTASAVAFALGPNLSVPVVFTGSQTTPEVLHGDSQANLIRSCMVAARGTELPEVVICFGTKIFRAVRAQKRDERRFEGFDSPTFPPLGEITEDILLDRERIREGPSLRVDLIRQRPVEGTDIQLQPDFSPGVLMVQLTPGLEPNFYLDIIERSEYHSCEGVILQTLGAGNVAMLEPYGFTRFLVRARHQGIPVLITSPYPWSLSLSEEYAPAAEPAKLGALIGGEMTAAAAVTKFRWALAAVAAEVESGQLKPSGRIERVREIMQTNFLGEKDGPMWQDNQRKPGTPTRNSVDLKSRNQSKTGDTNKENAA